MAPNYRHDDICRYLTHNPVDTSTRGSVRSASSSSFISTLQASRVDIPVRFYSTQQFYDKSLTHSWVLINMDMNPSGIGWDLVGGFFSCGNESSGHAKCVEETVTFRMWTLLRRVNLFIS